jgi:hypothetical protein
MQKKRRLSLTLTILLLLPALIPIVQGQVSTDKLTSFITDVLQLTSPSYQVSDENITVPRGSAAFNSRLGFPTTIAYNVSYSKGTIKVY